MGHYFHRTVVLLLPLLVAAVLGHPLSGQEAVAAAQQRRTEPKANVVGTAPDKDLR